MNSTRGSTMSHGTNAAMRDGTDPEGIEAEEMRKMRREAAIRHKEMEFQRKRKEEEEQKRAELERVKQEFEDQERRRQADKLTMMQRQAKIRAQRKADNDRLNKKRSDKIAEREAAWTKKANATILSIVKAHEEYLEAVAERHAEARRKRQDELQKARLSTIDKAVIQEELNQKRAENIEARNQQRQIRDALRTDAIKEEASEELMSFIQTPAPVPLKQVVCGRIRPVPTVTELLAAHRDAREEFEDLSEQDFEMRAVLRNQSLFQYVADVQAKAEERRVHPPEPLASDLMKKAVKSPRTKAKAGRKEQGSPSATMRSSGGFRGKNRS